MMEKGVLLRYYSKDVRVQEPEEEVQEEACLIGKG